MALSDNARVTEEESRRVSQSLSEHSNTDVSTYSMQCVVPFFGKKNCPKKP